MRLRAGVLAVGVIAVVAAGCSGEDAKKPSAKLPSSTQRATTSAPTTSASTPSSSTPSPSSAPGSPAAISQHTPAGAKATAGYLIRVIGTTYERSDTGDFKRLATQSCRFCHNVISEIDRLNAEGHPIALKTRWILHRLSNYHISAGKALFIADVTSGQTRYYDENTKHEKLGDPAQRVRLLITLQWGQSAWQVAEVNRLAN